jgi:hypothetical protein
MATKYKKYIINTYTDPGQKHDWSPVYKPQDRTKILNIDEKIVNKAKLYAAAVWFWPAMIKTEISQRSTKPHVHDYDEVLGLIGTDPKNPHDLCGETEVCLGGERHLVKKSALIYIPAGLEHGPFRETRIDRPIFHFEFRSTGKHQ